MAEAKTEEGSSARKLLADWANDQDLWVRATVKEVLESGNEIPAGQLDKLYGAFLVEKELAEGDPLPSETLAFDDSEAKPADTFVLVRLYDTQNVNALAQDQEIEFNPRVTVLFGENASGKTGYVRILKRLAAVRTAEEILPNINRLSRTAVPEAKIEYELNRSKTTLEWKNEAGVHPFQRLDIFDAKCAQVHVDDELTYVYTPTELSSFRYVHEAVDGLKKKLEAAIKQETPSGNPFLPRFSKGTSLYSKIETLGAASPLEELEKQASVSPDEEANLETMRNRVEALRSGDLAARIQVASTQADLLSRVLTWLDVLREFDLDEYNRAVERLRETEEKHRQATEEAFSGEGIPGVLSDAWKDFINAGEKYLRESGSSEEYPKPEEPCVYCRQPLADAAVSLIGKYRDYCNNRLREELDEARSECKRLSKALRELDTESLSRDIAGRLEQEGEAAEGVPRIRELSEILASTREIKAAAEESRDVAPQSSFKDVERLASEATAKQGTVSQLLQDLQQQSDKRTEVLATASKELRELEARLTLREVLPELRVYVASLKWVDKAKIVLGRFRSIARSLTEKSKIAGEQLLNQDFEKYFGEECEALRAPAVGLDFPGRRGEPARRKTISADHKLSAILSEGEQKVIALADFLAEARLQQKTAPVIFDDPVNSLDYKRLEHVVDHLVEISKTRQVIVFSHNILFVCSLLSRFEKDAKSCSYYRVVETPEKKGIITQGEHPRQDRVKPLRGRINKLIQEAQAVAGEEQHARVEKVYEVMRNFCEVLVEQELFQGVIERYQPNVRMTVLPQVKTDRLEAAVNVVLPIFSKCCRMMEGHSQPLETLNVRPTLDELRQDWDDLLAAREAYLA